jgi:alkylation response protein AidB-like acyl-CoA dehydrogenase
MEFRLDEGQLELQETVARFCADRFPLDALAGREGAAVDPTTWSRLADIGLLGILEAGSGLGVVDAAIAFEQLGSHLAPGPVLWTVLAAPLVPGAGAGTQLVAGVEASAITDRSVDVAQAADADVLLVLSDDAVVAHRTAELDPPKALDAFDPLTPVGRFSALGTGKVIGDSTDSATLRLRGTVLAAAMQVGVATRALEVARAYALERHQFGAPIGSFQAVKHLLADMYVRGSIAQSATYAAAAVLQDPGRDDPRRSAAGAKLLAGEAAIANAGAAIQVLGGMGFTWDMLPNHLLKRAWVLEHEFGDVEQHEAELGATFAVAAP